MTDQVKVAIALAVFILLAITNINNIIRHHKEKKEAEAQKKREGFKIAKELRGEDTE